MPPERGWRRSTGACSAARRGRPRPNAAGARQPSDSVTDGERSGAPQRAARLVGGDHRRGPVVARSPIALVGLALGSREPWSGSSPLPSVLCFRQCSPTSSRAAFSRSRLSRRSTRASPWRGVRERATGTDGPARRRRAAGSGRARPRLARGAGRCAGVVPDDTAPAGGERAARGRRIPRATSAGRCGGDELAPRVGDLGGPPLARAAVRFVRADHGVRAIGKQRRRSSSPDSSPRRSRRPPRAFTIVLPGADTATGERRQRPARARGRDAAALRRAHRRPGGAVSRSGRWPTLVVPAVLALLAAWSLIPFGAWWAGTDIRYFGTAWEIWLWGTLVAAGIAALLLVLTRGRAAVALVDAWRRYVAQAAAAPLRRRGGGGARAPRRADVSAGLLGESAQRGRLRAALPGPDLPGGATVGCTAARRRQLRDAARRVLAAVVLAVSPRPVAGARRRARPRRLVAAEPVVRRPAGCGRLARGALVRRRSRGAPDRAAALHLAVRRRGVGQRDEPSAGRRARDGGGGGGHVRPAGPMVARGGARGRGTRRGGHVPAARRRRGGGARGAHPPAGGARAPAASPPWP